MKLQILSTGSGPYGAIHRAHMAPVIAALGDSEIFWDPSRRVGGGYNQPLKGFLTFALGWEEGPADVFMPHGIADKNLRNAWNIQGFRQAIVSGPAWAKKLVSQHRAWDTIFIGGYPFLDPVFENWPVAAGSVVWAPTHSNSAVDLDAASAAIQGAMAGLPSLLLVVSKHPYDQGAGGEYGMSARQMAAAKVVIADIGSTAYEAMALGKPVVFLDFMHADGQLSWWPGSFEEQIYAEKIGRHVGRPEDLAPALADAVELGPTPHEVEFIEQIFPAALRGVSGKVVADRLRQLWEAKTASRYWCGAG